MRVRTGDHPRGRTSGGASARPARRWRAAALVAVAVAGVAVLLASGAGRDSHPPQGPETAAAIAARPGVEQVEPLGGKLYPPRYDTLDFRLNQLVARHEGRDAAPGTPAMDGDERVAVVVLLAPARAGDVAAYLREHGVALPTPATGAEFLAASMPIALLPGLAGRPGVQRVTVEREIQRFGGDGIAAHGADFWHDPGWKGSGVKIGVIDAGFVGYPNGISSGHLPTPAGVWCIVGTNPFAPDTPPLTVTHDLVTCVSGHALTFDFHGTWVTELLYDIAPAATYYIARVHRHSDVQTAVTWLIGQGVDVINMSLGTAWEGPGDGTSPYDGAWISQVARAVDQGIFVTVPSGNAELGSWFGPFRDSDGDNIMEWDENGDECNWVQLGGPLRLHVRWDDTWNGANDDLDFYIRSLNSTGANLTMSEESQTGSAGHNPFETISAFFSSSPSQPGDLRSGSYCLVVTREAGVTPAWVQLVIDGNLPRSSPEHWTVGYSLTSPGETTKDGVVTVGAASVLSTGTIQPTSSRGPIPKSNLTKPDIVGLDYVRVDTSGGRRIDGTSLAAPHVAGLAALVKQRNPTYTPAQIATYLKDNALPRGEPDPNNIWGHGLAFLPHIGPVITGDPRIGVTLTANTDAVDDIDDLPASPTFTYQWIRVASGGTEANISTATSATYTAIAADLNSTLKVKVSFTDAATTPNAEDQTSRASLKVVPTANTAATGKPTISGPAPLRVTHTLTAGTSAISDSDGVTGVTFGYQWVRVDGGTDTDIAGATESSYVLETDDEGKTVKVKVSFADNNRNAESVVSDASAVVGSAPNRPPTFPDTTASREVEENTPADQDIGDAITATDLDSDTLTYSIKNDSGLFEIVTITGAGQLRTKGVLDYETTRSHTIVVEVTDSKDIDGMADTVIDDEITVTINVLPVDEPPVISGPQTVDWPENAAGTIATYTAADPEGVATFLDLVDTGDYESFDFLSGRLSFRSTALPDFEGKQQYQIELGATTDPFALTFETTYAVTINITDVDEPPEITLAAGGSEVTVDGDAVSVDENHDAPLAYVTATDPESTHTDYTLALGGTHSGSFTLNAGVLSFTNPPNHEVREVYRLRLTASNADESSTLDVTVTVGDVNESPNITGLAEFTVNEGHTGSLRTYQKSDPDRPSQTTNWGPVGSSEVLSGADSDAFAFDQQRGRLTFASPPDFEGGGSQYQVTLTANDGTLEGTLDITVNVANLEETGTLALSGGVLQGANGVLLQATLTDPDGIATATWVWQRRTGTSGAWTDIASTNAASYTPTAADVGQYLRASVTYTDGAGTEETTLTVATESPTLNDDSGNQPPTPPDPLPQVDAIPENAGGRNVARVVFTDPEGERLTYSLDGSSEFAINTGTGQITVKSGGLDYEDTTRHEVTVKAADLLGASATATLTVDVMDVNEPPTAVDLPVRVLEDETVDIDVVGRASDQDAGDTLTVAGVVSSPGKGRTTVNDGTNDITYAPQANYHGADSFTYRVNDAKTLLSNVATVTITVDAVNDAPEFPSAAVTRTVSESASESDSVGAPVVATDIDSTMLTYRLLGAGASFEIDPGSGQITVGAFATLVAQDTYEVMVEVDDGSGEANDRATIDVTITVVTGPVTPPPSTGGGGGGGFTGGGGGGGGGGPSPSVIDFEWTVTRDIADLDSGHDKPSGQWSDGVTLWLLENGSGADDAVYAYDLASGERVEDREFELDGANRAPRGVWSDGSTAWVSDSGRNRLFAHDLESGERLEERDIALADRNRDARGIWSGDGTIWVLDGGKDSLFGYDLASGALLAEYELVSANGDPHGLWSDGTTVWVSDHGAKRLFAYRLPARPEAPAAADAERQTLERVRDEEFTELSKASNNSPRGLWSDGEVMYVADQSDGKVYSYNMPDAIDARLASLSLSGVDIGEFSPARSEYEGAADEDVTETTVTAEPAQRRASVAIDPPDADEAADGYQVALEDVSEITVTVTSEDGSRTRVYRVAFPADSAADSAAPSAQAPAASCLGGDVTVGFSLVVYGGGSVEDLVACAEGRNVTALYALDGGEYVSYILGAPGFVNEDFRALFADGAPALTPLTVKSEGPPSPDPSGGESRPGESRPGDATQPWPACLRGDVAAGFNLVLYEGGSVDDLVACAEGVGLAALYFLDDGIWVSYTLGAPEFVNAAFRELFIDGVPSVTPLVVKRD